MPDPSSEERLADFSADSRLILLTGMAGAIGVVSAFVALALVRLIGLFTNLFYFHRSGSTLVSPAGHQLGLWAVAIPVAGGLIIGLMARFGSEKIRGHGIPEALEAILIGRSRMSLKVAILKPLSSAISIGTGGPFGAEGPIIMTGGAFGSLFGQAFHLSDVERKTLLVAGAAGGMAAVFGTPVAAALLAVELLLFEWKPQSFIPVACACAVAGVLRVPLLGAGPIFPFPGHAVPGWTGLLAALVVGLAAGFGSGLLTWLVYGCEDLFQRLPIHWMWWPLIGGVVVGVGGLFYPKALGVGYDTIQDLLTGGLAGPVVLGLMLTKAVIWSVALGSGTSGGVLAPLLIMGGALGALEAPWLHGGDVGLWAMVSMGAMMGGTMRSPFTAIVFMLELTHDVQALPGLFVACIAADAVTVLLMKRSILTEKVARRGTHVVREYTVSPLHALRVGEVMESNVPTVPPGLPVATLFRQVANFDLVLGARHAWPIVDEAGRLVGIITRGDLIRSLERLDAEHETVLEAGSSSLVVTYPDEILERATSRMLERGIGRLPVVSREDPRSLVGYLGRTQVMSAWHLAARQERSREPGWLTNQLGAFKGRTEQTPAEEDTRPRGPL